MKLVKTTVVDVSPEDRSPKDPSSTTSNLLKRLVKLTNVTLRNVHGSIIAPLEVRLDGERRQVAYWTYNTKDIKDGGRVTLFVKTDKKDSTYVTFDPRHMDKTAQGNESNNRILWEIVAPPHAVKKFSFAYDREAT